jgi:hypothetical protein
VARQKGAAQGKGDAPTMTKAAFVRSRPDDAPIEQVIADGRALGLDIKPADVHTARRVAKRWKERGERGPRPRDSSIQSDVLRHLKEAGGWPQGGIASLVESVGESAPKIRDALVRLKTRRLVFFEPRDFTTLRLARTLSAGAALNGAHPPRRVAAKKPPPSSEPSDYLPALERDLTRLLGARALTGAADLASHVEAVKLVLGLLRGGDGGTTSGGSDGGEKKEG